MYFLLLDKVCDDTAPDDGVLALIAQSQTGRNAHQLKIIWNVLCHNTAWDLQQSLSYVK